MINDSYLHANKLVLTALLGRSEVELGQSKRGADLVAGMRVKEERHATTAKVTVTVDVTSGRVYLRISPQITNTLYVDDYHLMTRTFKREVAKCL